MWDNNDTHLWLYNFCFICASYAKYILFLGWLVTQIDFSYRKKFQRYYTDGHCNDRTEKLHFGEVECKRTGVNGSEGKSIGKISFDERVIYLHNISTITKYIRTLWWIVWNSIKWIWTHFLLGKNKNKPGQHFKQTKP